MIFMSYRRSDSLHFTARLYDRLKGEFGKENVFMDIDDIPIGASFPSHIEEVLSHCRVLLAIIGSDWRGEQEKEQPRIFEENDFVRIELETAFRENITVIPVLISDTTMPDTKGLPSGINELALINAATVDDGKDFHYHTGQLICELNAILGKQAEPTDPPILINNDAQGNTEKLGAGTGKSDSYNPARRVFLGVTVLSAGSLFAYVSGVFHYIVERFKNGYNSIPGDNFMRNTKTGVLHHIEACADHLPKVFEKPSQITEDIEEKIHQQKLPHIATLQASDATESAVVDLALATLKNRPTSVHLYKILIGVWGKNKDYDRIHSFLSSSIEYLNHQLSQTKSNQGISQRAKNKLERKYAKAISDLKQRKVRADFLASVSKAKQL